MGNTSAAEIHVYRGDSIQNAINVASPGDTIVVYAGTYTENVNIDKELKIITDSADPDDVTVQAANPKDHIFYINADNVTLKGFTLKGATQGDSAGTFLDGVEDCIIVNNTLSSNNVGISLRDSSHNIISNNVATKNYHGIGMLWSNENTLNNNNIAQNNGLGICLVYSNRNILENTDSSSNKISGIHFVTSSHNNLNNNVASGNTYGIYLDRSHDNKLSSCNISNNEKGIELRNSKNNTIDCNTLSNNKKGIVLRDASSRNRLYQNDLTNNDLTVFSNIYNLWNTTRPIEYYYSSNKYTSYLGNFYSNHIGRDVDSDGISERPYGKYDNYPLMDPSVYYAIEDTKSASPFISIISPKNGSSHTVHNVNLIATSPAATWMWYSLDKDTNSTHSNGTELDIMLTGLSEGKHMVTVYALDANDNFGKNSAEFHISMENTEISTIYVGNYSNTDELPISTKDTRQMAIRELPASSVKPGEKFNVHITKYNDCFFSQVVETIPHGFSYADSTLDPHAVEYGENEVKFILLWESSFEYSLIAPETEGTYELSGIIVDDNRIDYPIAGDSLIIVEREKR